MNGGTKTGVRVQTASKAEVRQAGLPPAPQIEEEDAPLLSSSGHKTSAVSEMSEHRYNIDVHVTVHRSHCEGKEPSRCDRVCSFAYFVASSWFFVFTVTTFMSLLQ
jgi:hypothetical protein